MKTHFFGMRTGSVSVASRYSWFTLLASLLVLVPGSEGTAAQPRNVILFIGDGMGFEQVKAARCFNGAPLSFEGLPYKAQATTASADNPVTDSAASGTALATGIKVNNYVVSTANPGDGSELQTTLEFSQAQGKRVGLVTTTYLTHATPAAFGAHAADRNYTAEIGSDYLTQTRPNVLFGGGGNGLTPASASAAGYWVATDTAAFNLLPTDAPYISAQFGTTYLPWEYDYAAGGYPYPHLSGMVAKALAALGAAPDGFFLMVEGGMIDQAAHSNWLERNVCETLELSRAVQAALDWASGRPDTLIVVTADHETGGLKVVQDNGPGVFPTVTWSTTGHTAANVPVFAWGPDAELVTGVLDNTDIHDICTGTRPAGVPLVASGATWKYEATGTDLGTAWRAVAYDDSAWPSGAAKLGYGDGDEVTILPKPAVFPCYYFRHTFTLDDPARYSALSLRILKDDGAVVYLNGSEVARYGMGTGTVTYLTWAATATDYAWDLDLPIPVNLLVAGANVIAVEVHQGNATSSDLALDLQLKADLSTLDPAPPLITSVHAQPLTDATALITWTTDEPATSRVDYSAGSTSYPSVSDLSRVTHHSVLLENLAPDTTYSYTVTSDDAAGNQSSSSGHVFTTLAPNHAPNADNLFANTTEDVDVALALSGGDPDGQALTFRVVDQPAHGSLSGTPPALIYTPNLNWWGQDAFSYVANDGFSDSPLAMVTVTVTSANDPPSAPVVSATAGDGEVALVWPACADVDGDSLEYVIYRSVTPESGYTEIARGDGTAFTDSSLQNGVTYSYVVSATDGTAWSASAPVTATPAIPDSTAYVVANPAVTYGTVSGSFAATQQAGDGAAQTLAETRVGQNGLLDVTYTLQTVAQPDLIASLTLRLTATSSNPNDALRVYLWLNGAWAEITADIRADGLCTPTSPASCVDSSGVIRVRLTDSTVARKESLDSHSIDLLVADVAVGNSPVNHPPVANADAATTAAGFPVTIAVLANDTEPDNDLVTVALVTPPANGSASLNGDGSFTYTPADGFSGTDTFTYALDDGRGGTDIAVVSVTVTAVVNSVHVGGIQMSVAFAGKSWKATTRVTVLNHSGQPALGATVTGDWLFNGTVIQPGVTAVTDATGLASTTSAPVKATSGTFVFRVTQIALAGHTYQPSLNVVSQGSISF